MSTPSKKSTKLDFAPVEDLTDLTRDYGLMRIQKNKVTTPYPKAAPGVDAELLRKRLSYQVGPGPRAISVLSLEKEKEERTTNSPPVVHIAVSKFKPASEQLLRGTPHPSKGKAIDPKLLIKSLEGEKHAVTILSRSRGRNTQSARSSINQTRSSFNQTRGSLIQAIRSVGTPHPNKSIVLNPKNLIRRLSRAKSEEFRPFTQKKKVVFISPEPSIISTVVSNSESVALDIDSDSRKTILSFEERRKQFHMGEFTIAKYGKKLCDWPLSEEMEAYGKRDSLFDESQRAVEEIETFIRKEGILKTGRNTVTGVTGRAPTMRASVESDLSSKKISAKASGASLASSASRFAAFKKNQHSNRVKIGETNKWQR